jgi:hypothetical protein
MRSYSLALWSTNSHSTFGVTLDAPLSVCNVFCRNCAYRMTRAGSSVRNSLDLSSGEPGVSMSVYTGD